MKVIFRLFSKLKLLILMLMVLFTTIILLIRNYIDNYEVEDGFQLLKSSSYIAAAAKLRPLADRGNKLAQSYLVEIYTNGMDDVYSKDSEALYWCVKRNQLSWYEELFNKDSRINLKLCELRFARENLFNALNNNLYYKDKFKSGINWLIILHSTGDSSTIKLFKKCNINSLYVNTPITKFDNKKLLCVCENFDWGDYRNPNCSTIEQINKIDIESK